MSIHGWFSCGSIFIGSEDSFKLCIFCTPLFVVCIKSLRYSSPACVFCKYLLFIGSGCTVFCFDWFQRFYCFDIVRISRLCTARNADIIIVNDKVFGIFFFRQPVVRYAVGVGEWRFCMSFRVFFNNGKAAWKKISHRFVFGHGKQGIQSCQSYHIVGYIRYAIGCIINAYNVIYFGFVSVPQWGIAVFPVAFNGVAVFGSIHIKILIAGLDSIE